MDMEHLTISGRLGRDAEVKTTARGNKYVSFTLAVDSKNKNGESVTNWYNVSSFQENHTGKMVDFLKKGKGLIVSGIPSYSIWTDRTGTARIDLNVKAFNLEFPTLTRKEDEQQTQANEQREPVARQAAPAAPQETVKAEPRPEVSYTPTAEPEDDLPF